jgi:hypothetical protein
MTLISELYLKIRKYQKRESSELTTTNCQSLPMLYPEELPLKKESEIKTSTNEVQKNLSLQTN